MKKLIPIGEAAKFLGVSIDTLRRYDRLGILHSTRPSGKVRYFDTAQLEAVKSSKPFITGAPNHYFKKAASLLVKVLITLLTVVTILFLLFPEQTARFFLSFI